MNNYYYIALNKALNWMGTDQKMVESCINEFHNMRIDPKFIMDSKESALQTIKDHRYPQELIDMVEKGMEKKDPIVEKSIIKKVVTNANLHGGTCRGMDCLILDVSCDNGKTWFNHGIYGGKKFIERAKVLHKQIIGSEILTSRKDLFFPIQHE